MKTPTAKSIRSQMLVQQLDAVVNDIKRVGELNGHKSALDWAQDSGYVVTKIDGDWTFSFVDHKGLRVRIWYAADGGGFPDRAAAEACMALHNLVQNIRVALGAGL